MFFVHVKGVAQFEPADMEDDERIHAFLYLAIQYCYGLKEGST